jgi:hypothetical protein
MENKKVSAKSIHGIDAPLPIISRNELTNESRRAHLGVWDNRAQGTSLPGSEVVKALKARRLSAAEKTSETWREEDATTPLRETGHVEG